MANDTRYGQRIQLPGKVLPPGAPLRKTLEFKNLTFTHDIATGTLTARGSVSGTLEFDLDTEEIEELRAMLRSIGKGAEA